MPRRRKIEVKGENPKEELSGEVKIKTETTSQDVKRTPENEDQPFARSLRPRKTKCYTERDRDTDEEPEIKAQRKRRRLPVENGKKAQESVETAEESQSNFKRTKKSSKSKSPTKLLEARIKLEKLEDITDPDPKTALIATSPTKENGNGVKNSAQPGEDPSGSSKPKKDDNNEDIKPKKKRKKRPKKVPVPVVPEIKTEPPDTPPPNPEQKDDMLVPDLNDKKKEPAAAVGTQAKPKPKRKRKPKSIKPGTDKEPPTIDPEKEVVVKTEDCDDLRGEGESNKDNQHASEPAGAPKKLGTANKRIRSRPKKPAQKVNVAISTTTADDKTSTSKAVATESAPAAEEADGNLEDILALRKPFSRGRRSRFLSVRTGKKEVVHTDEAIDPEDIRGFEHVERYTTPEGVKLPKFWDSEDEISDDESGDSFRRIMCGFGTNCRIHEVIRPASEIVRRLKELQTTFGTTKTLPLFQRERTLSSSPAGGHAENGYAKSGEEGNLAKLSSIMWHNDPMFFQYANNYP